MVGYRKQRKIIRPQTRQEGDCMKKVINNRKAAIIGCGFVGSASAFSLMQSGLFPSWF